MEFRLVFDGDLRPRQQIKMPEIHAVRQQLEPQLREAWNYPPLSGHKDWWEPARQGDFSARTDMDGSVFISIVSAGARLHAELDVLLMRAQPPGALVQSHGDIDNRLKTLLDALRVPGRDQLGALRKADLLPKGPFHCLLQDDSLVTRLSVSTDRLLNESPGSQRTLAIIHVKVKVSSMGIDNIDIMGG